MISHDSAFELLASAPVKQSNVIVAARTRDFDGGPYYDKNPIWTSEDALMEVKIDAMGQMLGTATKKATVKLIGIISGVKPDDLFQIRLGLYNQDPSVAGFDYISQGYYNVDTVDYDYDAGFTLITMYDSMWRASKENYSEALANNLISYPVTIQDFAATIADVLNLDLDPSFSSLPNASFQITEDLYSIISTATLQNAIQDIAGATGSTARISDTTLMFTQYNPLSENLDSDSLKTLKIGTTYGPVTSVVLGRLPQNDNVAINSSNPRYYDVASVNVATDTFTLVDHSMQSGNMIYLTATTMPAPLQKAIPYYVYKVDDDHFKLALTYSEAVAGTNLINITSAGSGTLSILPLTTRELQINNNEIVDKNRETFLPPLYNELSGIYWSDVKADTIGLGWHEVGDVISFTQGSVVVRAFLSEIHLVLAGSIKESMASVVPDIAGINYAAAGSIQASIFNTQIEVDKQNQTITSIVSRQDTIEGQVNDNFTQITQDVDDVNITVQKSGGGNLLLNSVGFAKEQASDINTVNYGRLVSWDYNPSYSIATHGSVTSFDSSESQNYGGISGRVVQMSSADYTTNKTVFIKQRVNVAVGTPLSFGLRVRSALGKGDAVITLTNDTDSFTLTINDDVNHLWEEMSIVNFMSSMPWMDIKISSTAEAFQFTDLRLLYGTILQGWVQSNAEILATNVQFNKDGMRIFDELHDTETRVTYNEFSTRRRTDGVVLFEADDSGVVTNDLTIKGSTTYVSPQGNSTIKQITIDPSNARGGIAFIKRLD